MLGLFIAVTAFARAVFISLKDPSFRGLLLFVVVLIFSGAIFYHRVEGWSYLNAVYFCVVTLATVGYGDYTPKTDIGKVFTIFYIIFGIGSFVVFVNAIITSVQEHRKDAKAKSRTEKETKKQKKKSA
jgi:voltage-gated potassium channel Kch